MPKKTIARTMGVVNRDSNLANAIQALLARTRALGNSKPSMTDAGPSARKPVATNFHLSAKNHQLPNKINTIPTVKPNSRSSRKEVFDIFRFDCMALFFLMGRGSNPCDYILKTGLAPTELLLIVESASTIRPPVSLKTDRLDRWLATAHGSWGA